MDFLLALFPLVIHLSTFSCRSLSETESQRIALPDFIHPELAEKLLSLPVNLQKYDPSITGKRLFRLVPINGDTNEIDISKGNIRKETGGIPIAMIVAASHYDENTPNEEKEPDNPQYLSYENIDDKEVDNSVEKEVKNELFDSDSHEIETGNVKENAKDENEKSVNINKQETQVKDSDAGLEESIDSLKNINDDKANYTVHVKLPTNISERIELDKHDSIGNHGTFSHHTHLHSKNVSDEIDLNENLINNKANRDNFHDSREELFEKHPKGDKATITDLSEIIHKYEYQLEDLEETKNLSVKPKHSSHHKHDLSLVLPNDLNVKFDDRNKDDKNLINKSQDPKQNSYSFSFIFNK